MTPLRRPVTEHQIGLDFPNIEWSAGKLLTRAALTGTLEGLGRVAIGWIVRLGWCHVPRRSLPMLGLTGTMIGIGAVIVRTGARPVDRLPGVCTILATELVALVCWSLAAMLMTNQ